MYQDIVASKSARRWYQAALTEWSARWLLVAVIGLSDMVALDIEGVRFELRGLIGFAPIALPAALLIWLRVGPKSPATTHLKAIEDFFWSVLQFGAYSIVAVILTYVAASARLPLADPLLARADAALGFDWDRANAWVLARPTLDTALLIAYSSFGVQPIVLLYLRSRAAPGRRNAEFAWLFMLTSLASTLISAAMPAFGRQGHLSPAVAATTQMIRNGTWQVMDLAHTEGIITFPSFHAALGVIFIYMSRYGVWTMAFLLPLNLAMILATPTVGGHYLVDTLAGIGLALLAILCVRRAAIAGTARTPSCG